MPKNGKSFAKGSVPIDVSKLSLFSTMYVNRQFRDSLILWEHYNMVALRSLWTTTGSSVGFGQFVGGASEERLHVSKRK